MKLQSIKNMFPIYAPQNPRDMLIGHVQNLCNLPVVFLFNAPKPMHFTDSDFIEFGKMRSRAETMASLCDFISNIVVICSKEKMVWANTRTIIALVENLESCWDRTKSDSIRKAMRSHALAWTFRQNELTVSVGISVGLKFPAASRTSRFFHTRPEFKNLFVRGRSNCYGSRRHDGLLVRSLGLGRRECKRLATARSYIKNTNNYQNISTESEARDDGE